jgi:hypothetical protein
MAKLAHISDIHFGRSFNTQIWKNVRAQIENYGPDILVISGDFVDHAWLAFRLLAVKSELEDLCRACASKFQPDWFDRIMFNDTAIARKRIEENLGIKLGLNEDSNHLTWRRSFKRFNPKISIRHNVKDACDGRLQCCDRRRSEGFVDPSGGSNDSMTLAVAHKEGSTVILDAVREVKPPFSPEATVEEFARLLKAYRCTSVYGDRYAGEWPVEQFRRHQVNYEPAGKSKSDLYLDFLPLVNSGGVDLLDNDRMPHQLVSLERRTARGGRDSIDHPRGAHDDVANAVAGAVVMAAERPAGFRRRDRAVMPTLTVERPRMTFDAGYARSDASWMYRR